MGMIGGGHNEEHEEGEAWLISYADMMTLLFGLFVILYSFSQVDEKKFEEFRKEMAAAFGGKFEETFGSEVGQLPEQRRLRAFQMLVSMMSLGDDMDEAVKRIEAGALAEKDAAPAMKEIAEKLKKADGTQLKPFGENDKEKLIDIALGDRFLFQPGSDVLRPEAEARLAEVATELQRVPNTVGIEVIGHSDGAPTKAGSKNDNWALSAQRAASVARALIRDGVDKRRLKVAGMGDLQPLFPEKTPDGKPLPENMAKNRRVHIVVKKVVDE